MTWVYEFENIVELVQTQITRHQTQRGYQTKLARAAGCQPSYLSQALRGRAHLTPDQLMGMADFWALTEDETEYLLDVLQLARAGTPALRRFMQKKLRTRRQAVEQAGRVPATEMPSMTEAHYYSHWLLSAVHIATSIPHLQTVSAIAETLRIAPSHVEQALQLLQAQKLVKRRGVRYAIAEGNIHLSMQSPLNQAYHLSWRTEANRRYLEAGPQQAVFYTAVHSLSRQDFHQIKAMINELISNSRQRIASSAEECLACLSIDWFSLSGT